VRANEQRRRGDIPESGLERSLKETTRQQTVAMETAWLEPLPQVLLEDSTQLQIHEKLPIRSKAAAAVPAPQASKWITATTSKAKRPNTSPSARVPAATKGLRRICIYFKKQGKSHSLTY